LIGQLISYLRKRMKLNPSESIYIFIGNVIPTSTQYLRTYEKNDYIYITIKKENTFGYIE